MFGRKADFGVSFPGLWEDPFPVDIILEDDGAIRTGLGRHEYPVRVRARLADFLERRWVEHRFPFAPVKAKDFWGQFDATGRAHAEVVVDSYVDSLSLYDDSRPPSAFLEFPSPPNCEVCCRGYCHGKR